MGNAILEINLALRRSSRHHGPLPGYEQEAAVSECSLQPHSLTLASDLSRLVSVVAVVCLRLVCL